MTEMDAILQTIREVETSLERRSARASAVVMMTWGAVAVSIFAFYAAAQRGAFDAADHAVMDWAWVPPIVLGYLLTRSTQVRLGRMRAEAGAASVRRLLVVLLVPLALLTLAIFTGIGWQLIPAMWVGFLGYTHLTWHERPSAGDRLGRAIAIASLAAAAVLALPWLWEWGNAVAGAWYAIFLFGHGVYRYYTA